MFIRKKVHHCALPKHGPRRIMPATGFMSRDLTFSSFLASAASHTQSRCPCDWPCSPPWGPVRGRDGPLSSPMNFIDMPRALSQVIGLGGTFEYRHLPCGDRSGSDCSNHADGTLPRWARWSSQRPHFGATAPDAIQKLAVPSTCPRNLIRRNTF
jgi:hypothetical protein